MERKPSFKQKFKRSARILLIALIVVLFWRGVDGLLDVFLFPQSELLSSLTSLLIAFAFVLFGGFKLKDLEEL